MKTIGKLTKIKKIYNKNNIEIIKYTNQNGIVVGKKSIQHSKYRKTIIIEFSNYTRIWMLPQEIEIIYKNIIK
uniref:Cytochrome b6-f complex subunit PetP n=1 Tax=Gracilariopsis mclachlanii TaxID=486813 RepID=A0A345UA78_9FLOR|nr:hypothetical protein [Gracilariopsis mclachlanii]AXI97364.1 hypothetical protein [Gracilariopsis mclachlanii]